MSIHTVNRDIQIPPLQISTDWVSFDDQVQTDTAPATITLEFEPGQREIIRADPDDCQQGFPDQISVVSIVLRQDVWFDGDCSSTVIRAGTDITDYLHPHYREELAEEEAAKHKADAYEPDYSAEAA